MVNNCPYANGTAVFTNDGAWFCTRTKAVTARWLDPHGKGVDLGFPQNR